MKLTIGRIVRFVDPEGGQWPAIITEVNSDTNVNLQVFRNSDVVPRLNVPLEASGPGPSWHWPERV